MRSTNRSLAGERFVVLGKGRLVEAVIRILKQRDAAVAEVPAREGVRLELTTSLEQPAACVLALDDRHEKNLRAALVVSEVNAAQHEATPVVVRAFDPKLADEIERGDADAQFRVRGAYSLEHLAAPDFVVAALVDEGEQNLATLRLGDQYVNVCRLRVSAAKDDEKRRKRRPLLGLRPAELLEQLGCQVLARRLPDCPWEPAGDDPLEADEEVLVGGQLLEVLHLVRRHSAGGPGAPPARPARLAGRRDMARTAAWRLRRAVASASMPSTWILGALLLLVTMAVAFSNANGVSGWIYTWVLTALGNPESDSQGSLFGAIGLLAGGAAVGIGISLASAHMIEQRTVEANRRHARRLRNHVVVVGLGDVGLQIAKLLEKLDVACAVVDTATDLETARRRGQIRRLPVVQADLEAGLPDARVDRAISLIATSDDNLLNVEACLRAKRERRSLRTIARIFDDAVAARGRTAFGVDAQISAAEVVAPAFVDAALHEHCLRMIDVDGWPMAALRWPEGNPVGARQMRDWHGRGVRLLAVWRRSEGVAARPDGESPAIERDQTAVLVGPHEAMERVLDQLRKRTAPQPPMRLELAA